LICRRQAKNRQDALAARQPVHRPPFEMVHPHTSPWLITRSPPPKLRFLPAAQYPVYLLFYRELAEEVEVLRVLHGARNLPPLFE